MSKGKKVVDLNEYRSKKFKEEYDDLKDEMSTDINNWLMEYVTTGNIDSSKEEIDELEEKEEDPEIKKFYDYMGDITDMIKKFYK